MAARDLSPYLGRHCQLMVSCSACGGTHVREGLVVLARVPGEILIGGQSFTLGEVRALVALPAREAESEASGVSLGTFDLVLLSGLALAALSTLRLLSS